MAKPAAFWTLAHARAKLTETQRLAEIKAGLGTEWVLSMKEVFHVSTHLLLILRMLLPRRWSVGRRVTCRWIRWPRSVWIVSPL